MENETPKKQKLILPCKDGKRHWWPSGWVCSKCGMRYVEYLEKKEAIAMDKEVDDE